MMKSLTVSDTYEERLKIVRRALGNKDDKEAQSHAFACLKAHPHEIEPYCTRTHHAVFRRLSNDNEAMFEMYRQAGAKLWRELAMRDAEAVPYVERLLIDRVVACHYALIIAERGIALQSQILTQREHFERAVERAHKQYLAALKTLAQVRRLNLPIIIAVNAPSASQVNVGSQQVNTV